MFLLNAVKLISVRARRFPGPPDGARPAVARAERLLRTRRRLARAVSLLTHRSRAGLLKASSTPRRSLCFHLSFSHSRARNYSLRFDLRIAKCAGGGGARTVLSKRLSRFQTFPSPPKVPSSPSLPLWTRPVHILRFNRLSVADEAGVSSAPSPHFVMTVHFKTRKVRFRTPRFPKNHLYSHFALPLTSPAGCQNNSPPCVFFHA